MSRINNLHIVFPEKFFPEYISFVNRNFDPNDHLFLYLKRNSKQDTALNVNIMKYYRAGLLYYYEMYQHFKRSERVILHSLSKSKVIYFLYLFPAFRKKCTWYLWGGDMYYRIEQIEKKSFSPLLQMFRSVVRDLGAIATHFKGDYTIAQQKLGFKGLYVDCFLYPSNLFRPEPGRSVGEEGVILVGNSAHTSNCHEEVLTMLAVQEDRVNKVICPLSYGDNVNATKIVSMGTDLLKDKFVGITEFMDLESYLNILSQVDIAVFNHWRQQGSGNIVSLIGMGKSVYIRKEITTWQMLTDLGIKVFDIADLPQMKRLTETEQIENIAIVTEYFCENRLKEQSAAVFYDL